MSLAANAWGALGRIKSGDVYYGWYMVAAGALTTILVAGTTNYGFGAFYEPMRQELGWSMAAIAGGASVRSVQTGFLSPFTGFLVDRLGPRMMAIAGTLVLVIGLILFSQAHDIWFYYLSCMVIALGQSLGGLSAYSAAVMRWFQKKRGQAQGLLAFGNGIAYTAVPVITYVMTQVGWRTTVQLAAALILVVTLPLCFVIRARPEPYGYLPDGVPLNAATAGGGGPAAQRTGRSDSGMSVREALRTPAFYLILMASAMGSATLSLYLSLQLPHIFAQGFSPSTAGLLVGVFGLSQAFLRPAAGWLGDRLGRRRMLLLSYVLVGVGQLAFANLRPDRLWLLPFWYGVFGIGLASYFVLSQTVVADYFGTARFATLRGLSSILTLPVGVLMPVMGGYLFDTTGSYELAFTIGGLMTGSGVIWQLLVRRPVWSVVEEQRQARASLETAGKG
ncbi:MAG: MFS transporter [Chloroflexi bacterium]|nr:MFS transporter [Chloroflexota bacterium]